VVYVDVASAHNVVIVGCGLAGCGVVTILKESFSALPAAPAFLVAVDDNEEALGAALADKKILVKAGESLEAGIDFGQYEAVFFVLEPSETSSLTWAQVLSSAASEKKAYTMGFVIKPSGGWPEDEKTVYGSFDGSALIDEGWVLQLRKGKGPEFAMRIAFNFIAHTLTFMAEAIREGKLSKDALWKATYGKVADFAATSTSQPETLFNMTMSKVNKASVKSVILFMPEDTDNMLARRTFLYVAAGLPRSMEMIALRVKYVEPFRIVAMMAS
jgi:hypothetical protein